MPYSCRRKDCKQSDGTSGTYVMVKTSTGEEVSCHTDKDSCEAAIRAIEAEENKGLINKILVLIEKIKQVFF